MRKWMGRYGSVAILGFGLLALPLASTAWAESPQDQPPTAAKTPKQIRDCIIKGGTWRKCHDSRSHPSIAPFTALLESSTVGAGVGSRSGAERFGAYLARSGR